MDLLTNNHAGLVAYALNVSRLRRQHPGYEPALDRAVVRHNAERINMSAQWAALMDLARADRADRVAERGAGSFSLSFAAQDAGLVPHAADCIGCTATQRILTNAAALIGWEYRHPWAGSDTSRQHPTAWAVARA